MTALRIEPVIEVLGDTEFDLWPVVGRDGSWLLALHGEMREREVGTAVHQILRWFYADDRGRPASTIEEYLARALASHGVDDVQPMAMGGLRFTDVVTGGTILPGCCFSIDERSEMSDVLDGKRSECWLGHIPSVGVTVRDGLFEVAQDTEDPTQPVLTFDLDEARAAFAGAEADLDRFCDRATTWAAEMIPGHTRRIRDSIAGALVAGSHRGIDGEIARVTEPS
jgi:hypothetical protein